MGNEAQPTTETQQPKTETPEAKPAPVSPVQAAPAPAAGVVAPTPEMKAANGVPTRKLIGDEDEIPNDTETLLEMKPSHLKGRLQRATAQERKTLFAQFGVESAEGLQSKLDKLRDLEEKEEAQRLAQMTEVDRLNEQLTKEREARSAAEARVQQIQDTQVIEREDRRVLSIMEKHLDPDTIEDLIPKLARHLNGKSVEDLANPDAVIEAWCKEFVEKKPKFGKDYAAAASDAKKDEPAPVKQIPLDNGAKGARPDGNPVPPSEASGKTPKPGQPNSMSQAELAAYKRQHGLNY